MTAESTTERAGPSVERKLHRAWRRQRRFHNTRGLCHLLVWIGALGLADFLVDWLFLLPGYGRVILLAINLGTLGWVTWHSWLRHLRRYDPVRVALQVEGRHPDLTSLLVSYVQLDEGREDAAHVSRSLIRATKRLAVEATAPIDFREIIHWADLTRVGVFSACVVLVCGGLSLNWPEFFSTLAQRLLNPTARLAYPTRTTIEQITGDRTVPQGAPVTVEAECAGLVPASGTLWIKPTGGEWERLLMPQAGPRRFAYRFEQVLHGFTYRLRLGDARSEAYRVRAIPPPHLVRTRVQLGYPPYTGLKDATADSLHLEVPEGTKVSLDLGCDRPLAKAEVIEEGGVATPMRLDAAGRTATFSWTVTQSFPFRFRWTEREHGFVYEGDVAYFVRMIPDVPPDVEILSPTEDNKATLAKRLAVRYRAADDYGIAKGTVVYSVNEGPEQRLSPEAFDRSPVDAEVAWSLKETIRDLKIGDTLTFAVEVADNRTGEAGPNVTRSQSRRLDVVTVAEYLRYMAEKRARLFKEIRAMHEQETDASVEVKALKDEVPADPAAANDAGR